ncbi:MAG: hypothetical protein EOM72_00580 [Opitutae bacterium]|nr:hypothetical protein [Opitutae bacterium]
MSASVLADRVFIPSIDKNLSFWISSAAFRLAPLWLERFNGKSIDARLIFHCGRILLQYSLWNTSWRYLIPVSFNRPCTVGWAPFVLSPVELRLAVHFLHIPDAALPRYFGGFLDAPKFT